jgi:hypothetical protein
MLDKNGRCTYQDSPAELANKVDFIRAVNEIALVNTKTYEVTYGVASLIKILQHSFPFVGIIFRSHIMVKLAERAYRFVSFNRRVIIPASGDEASTYRPALHKGYRMAFILFAWLVTAFLLNRYSTLLNPFLPASSFHREMVICGGQIIWQVLLLWRLNKSKIWEYLGHLMAISLGGAVLLGVFMLTFSFFQNIPVLLALAVFFMVVGAMFFEHIRRTMIMELPWMVTASWVLYRCIILFFIL